MEALTWRWSVHPYMIRLETVAVAVEALQIVSAIVHGGILLMSEDQRVAWCAFAICFGALSADGCSFIALEFSAAENY